MKRICCIVLIFATLLILACKQKQEVPNEGGSGQTVVDGKNITVNLISDETQGSVKAKFKNGDDIQSFPVKAKDGDTILFTVSTKPMYVVKEWEGVDSVTDDNLEASLKVKKDTTVSVKYEKNSSLQYEFVAVNPPPQGIIGKNPTYELPDNRGGRINYKGVFEEGRKIKLSPYKIGKTACTYDLYYHVREWAEKNGYAFMKKGLPGNIIGMAPPQGGLYENEGAPPTEETKNHPVTLIIGADLLVWCNAYTEMMMGESECVYRDGNNHNTILKDSSDGSPETAEIFYSAFADITKKGFRLPSEAEWEFAARYQGDGSKEEHKENADEYGPGVWLTKLVSLSGAKKIAPLKIVKIADLPNETTQSLVEHSLRFGDYNGYWDPGQNRFVKIVTKRVKTKEVGKKEPNALGIHDMSGGVYEYCFDPVSDDAMSVNGYDQKYLDKDGFVVNPMGGAGDPNVRDRVTRGGSYSSLSEYCLTGWRSPMSGLYLVGNFHNGFRIAASQ